jgi:hypothetical protein
MCKSPILAPRRSVLRCWYLDSVVKNAYAVSRISLLPTVINFDNYISHIRPKSCSCCVRTVNAYERPVAVTVAVGLMVMVGANRAVTLENRFP